MTYDFVIIGGGPGGYTAALRAAMLGAKVALVEKEHLGGVCLNWGCIPTKALLKSSKLREQMTKAAAYGISCDNIQVDMPAVIGRKNKVVDQLKSALAGLMKLRKIDVFDAVGKISAPDQVLVSGAEGEQTLSAKNIIIATGSQVADLPGLACDGDQVIDIKSALNLEQIPDHIVIIGAGVVGCEMAQFYSGLGSQVSLVEILDSPLAGIDRDIQKVLVRGFKKRKYKLYMGAGVTSLERGETGVKVMLDSGKELDADKVLVSVGMGPVTKGLGLEQAGVQLSERGHIVVDEHCRTSVDNIYAIGDVTGIQPLAHFASHMGLVTVKHAMGDTEAVIDKEAVPKAVFIDPELAWVGLTEEQARDRFGEVITGQFLIRGLGRATAEGALDGLVKLVARAEDQVIVGAHILGPESSSIIAEATLAMAKGLTLSDVAETIHAHPTYGEAMAEAAETALGLPIHGA